MEAENLTLEFTKLWFNDNIRPIWDEFVDQIDVRTILEIGSFEGASICYLIERLGFRHALDIHCIDTWAGSEEHQAGASEESDMAAVEERFHRNVRLAGDRVPNSISVTIRKAPSFHGLSELIAEGKAGYFDFIYVDGSHEAADVITDAVLSFRLLKVGGFMIFDDYMWREAIGAGVNPIRCPKPAIDAFTLLFWHKIHILSGPSAQIFVRKTAA